MHVGTCADPTSSFFILILRSLRGYRKNMPKQHRSKSMNKLLDVIEEMGFEIVSTKKGMKILPPEDISGPVYHTHGTESAYHQMVRDFRKMYGIELAV